jgi:hypothetical protein
VLCVNGDDSVDVNELVQEPSRSVDVRYCDIFSSLFLLCFESMADSKNFFEINHG